MLGKLWWKWQAPGMPRANRYVVPGMVYHVTHRCHDRSFLLRFACDRDEYRERLRRAVKLYDLSVLGYTITSNHTHLLIHSESTEALSAPDAEAGRGIRRVLQHPQAA